MVIKILVGLVVLIVGVVVFASTKPDSFRITRSMDMSAPPATIFALIQDLGSWPQWSPYEKLDPHMKRMMGPISQGKGATFEWDGNSQAGAGRMEITQAVAPSRVEMALEMKKPMAANNQVEFLIDPTAGGSRVTWTMTGASNLFGKVFAVFVDCDKMVGSQFEEGLTSLKKIVESTPPTQH